VSLNASYTQLEHLPATIPLFPLSGALLLPRAQLPLNIFEPRYLAMVDHALCADRCIGMIQPASGAGSGLGAPPLRSVGCIGRITQFAETGDGRYFITLTGIARFRISEELEAPTPFRQCRGDYRPFAGDLVCAPQPRMLDRAALLDALKRFAKARQIRIDWEEVDRADDEALVNALSIMSPFGAEEKQALLEASDLVTRADLLVAITEIEIAGHEGGASKLQ